MEIMKKAVKETASRLCKVNNKVTTLELKVELRKTHPHFFFFFNSSDGVTGVSEYMQELNQEGFFSYIDTGKFRIYSDVSLTAVKSKQKKINTSIKDKNNKVHRISRQRALNMISNNKGHFFTAVFTKQNGEERTINCQYLKDQKNKSLGYVMVKEVQKMKDGTNSIRQINMQTLRKLRIGGQTYTIRK